MHDSEAKVTGPRLVLSWISSRAGLRKILANTGWLFVDRFVSLLAGFVVGAWVARYLGPTQYGLLNYALAFVAVSGSVAGLGLADVMVRETVSQPEDKGTILGTAFALQSAASILTFVLTIVVSLFVQADDNLARWLITITAGQLLLQPLSNTLDQWFRSQVQSKYVVWANDISLILIAVTRLLLILCKAPLTAFAWATLVQAAVFSLTMTVFYYRQGQAANAWHCSIRYAKRLLRDCWPLLLSSLAIVVYMRIGQLMLKSMMGDESLGIYSAAVKLSEIWYFLPSALAVSVFPSIIRSRKNQTKQEYQTRLQVFYDVMAGAAYVIVIPCVFAASPLIALTYGPEYAEAGPILAVHICAFVFVSLGVARSQWLIAENMTHFSMYATLLGAVVSIGLNYLLIPRYSGLGAAWATLISQAISAYLSSLLSPRVWPAFRQLSLSLLVPIRLGSLRKAFHEII